MIDAHLLVTRFAIAGSEISKKKIVMVAELCNSYFIRFWGRFESFVKLCVETCNKIINSKKKREKVNISEKMTIAFLERNFEMDGNLKKELRKQYRKVTYYDLRKNIEKVATSIPLHEILDHRALISKTFHEDSGLENQLAGFLDIYGLGALKRNAKQSLKDIRKMRNTVTHGEDSSIQELSDVRQFIPESDGAYEQKRLAYLELSNKTNLNESIELIEVNMIELEEEKDLRGVLDKDLTKVLRAFTYLLNFFILLMRELYIVVDVWRTPK